MIDFSSIDGGPIDPPPSAYLRLCGRGAAMGGAIVSVALVVFAGQGASNLLMVIMSTWVLTPWILLALLDQFSDGWSGRTRRALYRAMMIVAAGSLVVYGADAIKPLNMKRAVPFVLTPPISSAFALLMIAIASRRPSRKSFV